MYTATSPEVSAQGANNYIFAFAGYIIFLLGVMVIAIVYYCHKHKRACFENQEESLLVWNQPGIPHDGASSEVRDNSSWSAISSDNLFWVPGTGWCGPRGAGDETTVTLHPPLYTDVMCPSREDNHLGVAAFRLGTDDMTLGGAAALPPPSYEDAVSSPLTRTTFETGRGADGIDGLVRRRGLDGGRDEGELGGEGERGLEGGDRGGEDTAGIRTEGLAVGGIRAGMFEGIGGGTTGIQMAGTKTAGEMPPLPSYEHCVPPTVLQLGIDPPPYSVV